MNFNTSRGRINTTPTVGTLERQIMVDRRLAEIDKRYAIKELRRKTGYASPSTPLDQGMLARLGGGAVGALVARYFNMGIIGQAISGYLGYSAGSMVANHMNNANKYNNKYYI